MMFFRTALMFLIASIAPALAQTFDYSPDFVAGAPDEVAALKMTPGKWSISLEYPAAIEDGEPVWAPWATTGAVFERRHNGAAIIETNDGFPIAANAVGADGQTSWSFTTVYGYDRYAELFRAMIVDNVLGLPDIYEGWETSDGLVFSNFATPTANNLGRDGGKQKSRFDMTQMTPDSFELTWWTLDMENAVDGAELMDQPWQPSVRMHYTLAD